MAGRRAIVIGGSMSGLVAGLMLVRRGWEVDVFERVEIELSGRGAGIVAHPELLARLRALGIDTAGLGYEVATRKIFDVTGALTHVARCAQTMTAWERVHRLLRDAFDLAAAPSRYHGGRWLKRFDQDAGGVTALFNDGRKATADLLVGADGLRSTVRRLCEPRVTPRYAGYVAWRALVREAAIPDHVRRDFFDCMAFCLPAGEQFLAYPVAGPDGTPDHLDARCNIVWYRPAEEQNELKALLTDRHGVAHAISIPPPLLRPEAIEAMRADAQGRLCPQFRALVPLMTEPILQPIYDLESRRMAFGRVALIGDAAFVARPHVAAGVTKAADDAAALVDALDTQTDVAAALRSFEAGRLPENRRIIERARHLGTFLQATQTGEDKTRSLRHGIPEAVLAETASLDFLRA